MNGKWADLLPGIYHVITLIIIVYVVTVTLVYAVLFGIAARKLRREKGVADVQYNGALSAALAPPLSILVPAYNEELNIVWSIRSLLGINYGTYEIIVVNDGSKDDTVGQIIREFDMMEIRSKIQWSGLGRQTKPIRAVYRSRRHPNLLLVDKLNGGKADALNAGINISKYPYFVSLDGDTILDPDAFIKIMKPVMDAKPGEEIIATGGSVGIANGSEVDSGHLNSEGVSLSRNPLVVMQVIEYLRAFLMGRVGLSRYNLLLIVSGAFGVFRKDWVIQAGGYETGTIGEDMELIVRLHRLIRERKSKARIVYIPDPVCWTEAPENLTVLRRQRIRWHQGLFESLWKHRSMIFRPGYGRIGMIAMPYFTLVELLGPVVEVFGYAVVLIDLFFDAVYVKFTLLLAVLMILYGSLLSMGAVLFEEWSFKRYNKVADLIRLFVYALSESFWYRPLMTAWRFRGLLQAVSGKRHSWGEMTRKGGIMNKKQQGSMREG